MAWAVLMSTPSATSPVALARRRSWNPRPIPAAARRLVMDELPEAGGDGRRVPDPAQPVAVAEHPAVGGGEQQRVTVVHRQAPGGHVLGHHLDQGDGYRQGSPAGVGLRIPETDRPSPPLHDRVRDPDGARSRVELPDVKTGDLAPTQPVDSCMDS